jgi:hypothetical protein
LGATINAALVTGLSGPSGIAVSGENLFVTNAGGGTIGKYTTSGATVNATLITGLDRPVSIAISAGNLFVTNYNSATIGKYTTSGATVNASLVSGLDAPEGVAVSGGNLFVANGSTGAGNGFIGKYTTAGATVNASLVSGLNGPTGITVLPAPLQLEAAISFKGHGMVPYAIDLPLTGAPGVECRSSAGNHTLVFTFNNNVFAGSASVTSGVGTVAAGSPSFSGNHMTVSLTGVADVQKVTITLSNVTDGFNQVLPNTAVSVNFLIGDTNGNKAVNASDVAQTKAQSGLSVTSSNFREDVTVSGVINASDVALVKSRSGFGVP